MLFFWRTSDLAVLLIWGIFVAASSCMHRNQTAHNSSSLIGEASSCMHRNQTAHNSSSLIGEVNNTVSVQMGKKALLCCPAIPLTKAILITWTITPRGQPSCRIAYKVATKETNETNCNDRRITWDSTPDRWPDLQISAVALEHDGYYSCDIATPEGNFLENHDLQVQVPPHLTLLTRKNRTAVCEAITGKPAAQIIWTPDGDCGTKKESHSNGTVTVKSTCHWKQDNVSTVVCFVFHSTGNCSLSQSLEVNGGGSEARPQYLPYIISPVVILAVIGCIWLSKISGFRKYKLPKSEATSAIEEISNKGLKNTHWRKDSLVNSAGETVYSTPEVRPDLCVDL